MNDLIASLTNIPTIPTSLMATHEWFLAGLALGFVAGLLAGYRWRRY